MIAQLNDWMPMINEIFFTMCGIVSIVTGIRGLKNKKAPYGTFAFWTILGSLFILGKFVIDAMGDTGAALIGMSLFVLAALTFTKQVQIGEYSVQPAKEREEAAKKYQNKIFIPAVTLAVVAMALAQVKIPYTVVVDGVQQAKTFVFSGAAAIGIASVLALLFGFLLTKANGKEITEDSTRLMMTVGSAALLPQLLGALGSLFSTAGVGVVISNIISTVIPSNSVLIGVIVYVLGMVIFTIIMGNAFAAFAVITAGIGIPFVILQGGSPAIVGALGMTSGYCGTLLTPMAANFNIVPSAVLETKSRYTVIKAQVPISLTLIVAHIILMLVLAF